MLLFGHTISLDSLIDLRTLLRYMRTIGDRAAVVESVIAQFRDGLSEVKCMSGDRMRRTGLSFAHGQILGMLDRHGEMPVRRLGRLL